MPAPAAAVTRSPGTEADGVLGVVPGEVARPTSIPDVARLMAELSASGSTVVPVGGGTKLGWAPPPRSCDVRLDLTGLDRVVEHVAGDLVVVAEAGVRLSALQRQLAGAGQQLALDPPEEGCTLGGVVSANAAGPRRLRYGTVRDLLIGITVVLADGSVASAGGKVVKNVAGYDLGKLFTGAHGTLGVVVSTTWRLHPLPRARRVVSVPVPDPASAGRLALQVRRSTLTPTAAELLGGSGTPTLVVVFESIPESVTAQAEAAAQLLGGEGVEVGEALPEAFGARPGGPDDLVLRLAFAPAALPAVLDALPPTASYAISTGVGVGYAAVPPESAAALPALRTALAAYDGSAVVVSAPSALRADLDHWGPVGDALELMRRVKDRFDPAGLLSPGRFVGGL